jgi:superfamily II DNA or RNA helicase
MKDKEAGEGEQPPRIPIGSMVVLVGKGGKTGVVMKRRRSTRGAVDCQIYFGPNDTAWFPEGALVVAHEVDAKPKFVPPAEFFRNLAIVKLENKLTDTLFSVQASRTALEPYQFKPVLQFLQLATQRLILADEVGLGKTIEAALILTELKARTDVQRALVVCPSRLAEKWKGELRQRFDEDFAILNARSFDEWIAEYVETDGVRPLRGIVPLETLRAEWLLDLIEESSPTFDLAIIDEAHHLRNPDTLQNRAGHVIADHSEALLLLTATPIQLHSEDLFELLRIADEGQFDSLETYLQLDEPNHHINGAIAELRKGRPNRDQFQRTLEALRQVEQSVLRARFLGSRLYRSVVKRLTVTSTPTFADVVTIHRDLRQLNTLSSVMIRTTKRDVKGGAVRSPHVISVPLNERERAFYDSMLEYVRLEYATHGANDAPGFVLVQRERQAASCLRAAAEVAEQLVRTGRADPEVEDNITDIGENGDEGRVSSRTAAQRMLGAARNLGNADTKYDLFEKALNELLAASPSSKVLVFSTFKRTLRYLERRLRVSFPTITVRRLDGDVRIEDRPAIVEDFARSRGFGILLISEVGSEGLDFQFCDIVFNYDLPWNPMRVEQRIGRLDRYGQTAERIRIYSFVLEETIEERILLRLYERIRIFEESIGDLAPILGKEIPQIEREIFRQGLSEREIEKRTVDSLRRIENEMREREEFHEKRKALIHQDLVLNKEIEELIEGGRYITPGELRHVVSGYLELRFPGTKLEANDKQGTSYRLVYSAECKDFIGSCARRGSVHRELASSLMRAIQENRPLPVTFSGEIARKRPAIHFLNMRHPITETALKHFLESQRSPVSERLLAIDVKQGDPNLVGTYWFFLYMLKAEGNEASRTLAPIVIDEHGQVNHQLEDRLLRLLADAAKFVPDESHKNTAVPTPPATDDWQRYEAIAHDRFVQVRGELQAKLSERNNALTDARIAALTQTYEMKASRLERWMREATSASIRRMREGQISRAQADLKSRIALLESRREVRVGGSLELAGRMTVAHSPEARGHENTDAESADGQGGSRRAREDAGSIGLQIANRLNLVVVDKRPGGGVLWIVDPDRIGEQLAAIGFKFAHSGGRASQYRPAWFLPKG